jgi:hypothetical protein
MMLEIHLELLNNALYQQLLKLSSVDQSNRFLIVAKCKYIVGKVA